MTYSYCGTRSNQTYMACRATNKKERKKKTNLYPDLFSYCKNWLHSNTREHCASSVVLSIFTLKLERKWRIWSLVWSSKQILWHKFNLNHKNCLTATAILSNMFDIHNLISAGILCCEGITDFKQHKPPETAELTVSKMMKHGWTSIKQSM